MLGYPKVPTGLPATLTFADWIVEQRRVAAPVFDRLETALA